MASSCPNCNQTVLPTDSICWQCGYRLASQPAQRQARTESATAVASSEPFSPSAVVVYSGVTAVIIIILLLTMRGLGQQPLVLLNPDTNVNTGWLPVTDQFIQFTLDIPPTWQSWEKQNPQQRDEFAALLTNDEQLATAVMPLSATISDMEILMIIMAEQAEQETRIPGFVIVTRSEEIGRLTLDDIIALMQQSNSLAENSKISRFRSFVGDERTAISLDLPQTKDHLSCQQHLVDDETAVYLLVGCAPEVRYPTYREPLEKILASFQLLR